METKGLNQQKRAFDKFKLAYIIILLGLLLFRIWQTTGCKRFIWPNFNPIAIKINVEGNINTDLGIERSISRFFHNKITAAVFEFTKSYASTFEPKLLFQLIGPLGITLFIASILSTVNKVQLIPIIHLSVLLFVSLLTVIKNNPLMNFYLVMLAWGSYLPRGLNYFLASPKAKFAYIVLVALTFSYFLFSWQLDSFCLEIFYN